MNTPLKPILNVINLWKSYGDLSVLERVNLRVLPGEFCALVGPSGCGKSTFLRLLMSQERPDRGRIMFEGKPLPPEPGPERGVVFQRYSVYPHMNVLQNAVLGLEFTSHSRLGRLFGKQRKLAEDYAREVLDAVGLAHALNKYPHQLSGGMQQRLAIAQSLVIKPRVLLLDEPFGALDPGTRKDIHALMLSLWRDNDMTVFMVTHDLEEGFKLATRLLAFDKIRNDPHAPDRYGATITLDLPLDDKRAAEIDLPSTSSMKATELNHVLPTASATDPSLRRTGPNPV